MNHRTLLFLAALSACNPVLTPISERQAVTITASTGSQQVIWVLDSSGSMTSKADVSCSGSQCATRKSELLAGMAQYGGALPTAVSHSSVIFPTDNICGAPSKLTSSGVTFEQVFTSYESHLPAGGTPTSQTLSFVASLPVAAATETFVVLVTDGLPNCNPDNPNTICADQSAGRVAACNCQTSNCSTTFCSLGCLDDLATVANTVLLGQLGLQLMVIGVGADITSAPGSFAAMEMGLPRTCTTNADCPQSTCGSGGVCASQLYLTSAAADLSAPMARLNTALTRSPRCTWWLAQEVSASSLSVSLDGQSVPSTEWSLKGAGASQHLAFSGASCERLLESPALRPVFALAQ